MILQNLEPQSRKFNIKVEISLKIDDFSIDYCDDSDVSGRNRHFIQEEPQIECEDGREP